MRLGLAITFVLQCAMGNLLLGETNASAQETASSKELKIRDTEVSVILQRLGAKMETGLTLEQQLNYTKVFRRFDRDGDLRHSKEEYIKNGRYLTPQSRRGIFNASDADKDGFVYAAAVNVEEEFVEMLEAKRQYANNVEVVTTLRALMMRTINMGK